MAERFTGRQEIVEDRRRSRSGEGTATISPNDDIDGSIDASVEDANGTVGKLHWQGSAEAGATVRTSFSDHGGMRGQLRAKTQKFKIDIDDKSSSSRP